MSICTNTRRFARHASFLLSIAAAAAVVPVSRAEYLRLPYTSQFDLGGDVADTTYPSAGIWGEYRDDNTLRNTCSAVRIESNIQDTNQYVLTAAHCITPTGGNPLPILGDNRGSFRNGGLSGPEHRSSSLRRHPRYNYDSSANDIALGVLPLNDPQNQYPPIGLVRNYTLPDGMTFYAVGFGHTGWNGVNNTGEFTTRRNGLYAVNGFLADTNRFTFPRADGTQGTDPRRHLCHSDSGGPDYLSSTNASVNGKLIGLHSTIFGDNWIDSRNAAKGLRCDGNVASMRDVNLTVPLIYNWVDSYSRRAVNFDGLDIEQRGFSGLRKPWFDSFEPPANPDPEEYDDGGNGTGDGWRIISSPAITHPIVNLAPNPNGWRYINSIGQDNAGNPELYTTGQSAQGVILESGNASVIAKDFPIDVLSGDVLQIKVNQRWNSLGLGTDFGVKLPDGSIRWQGLAYSSADDVNTWLTRTFEIDISQFQGQQNVTVYLLVVPEPSAILLFAPLMLMSLRRRSN